MSIRGYLGLKSLTFRGLGVVGVIIACLFSTVLVSAQEEAAIDDQKDIYDLVIPSSWGTIKDIYKGSSKEVIVHIQDAHANYEAQNNIANIIDLLVEEYGLTVAGVEGSVGEIPTGMYSTFPEDSVRDMASDFFVREGVFSGPEALVIKKGFEYPLKLYGIEDQSLYDNNFKAFQDSLPFKEEAKDYFTDLTRSLSDLKTHIYNDKLTDIDAKQLAFELKVLNLNQYCIFLNDELKGKVDVDKKYPNFSMLIKAIKIEESLNFLKAEEERTKLLTELTNILAEEDIRALLDKGLAYKNEQMSASRYLSFVKELAVKNQIDFNDYKNLDKYIDYASSYDNIKSFELFNEIEQADADLRATVYDNAEQKKLDFFIRGLKVMERLIEIKMVNKDLQFYKTNQENLKVDKYINFITEQSNRFGVSVNLPKDIAYLDVYIPAWVDFYQVAGLRDDAMINNTISVMEANKQNIIVMVTGGFHTRELTKKMQEKDISYIVITPRITRNIQGPYFDRITGKKTAFQSFLEGSNVVVPTGKKAE